MGKEESSFLSLCHGHSVLQILNWWDVLRRTTLPGNTCQPGAGSSRQTRGGNGRRLSTKSCPSERSCKILINSRDQDVTPCTQLWERAFLKQLGEAQQSLSIAQDEINES